MPSTVKHPRPVQESNGFFDPLSLALIAFGIFTAVMAVGIYIDQWMNTEPCDPQTQQCIGQEQPQPIQEQKP